jgi:hypothetical protein
LIHSHRTAPTADPEPNLPTVAAERLNHTQFLAREQGANSHFLITVLALELKQRAPRAFGISAENFLYGLIAQCSKEM